MNETQLQDKVTLKEKAAYVLTNLGNIPVQTILGSFLLVFYTNVVGLNPAACATLFLIARILDGLNDPFVGFFIDRLPTTKHGHFRPSLIIGTILCTINFVLLFFGPYLATSGKLVIAYVTYLLIGVLFPVMDISLNSMLPVMTNDMNERNALSSIKGVAYMFGMFGLNIIAPLIIGDTTKAGGYITMVLVAAAIILVFSIVGTLGLKERVKVEPGQNKYGIKDLFKILGQKPVAITFLSSLVYMCGTYGTVSAMAYFFTYVIPNMGLMSMTSLLQLVGVLPAGILVIKLIQRYGKKKTYAMSLVLGGLIPLVRLIDVTNVPILLVCTLIAGFVSGFGMPLTYGIQADNSDYVELHTGHRADAAVAALSSFITKCGMGIGGAIPGYLLAIAGFDATLETQPAGVRTMVIICSIVLPAVFSLLGALVFSAYPLTKEKLIKQNEEMAKLHAGE